MSKKKEKNNILVKMTSFFFMRWKLTLLLWAFLLGFGALTYTSIIKREGFPPIQFPLSFVNATYFVDDVDAVDSRVALPLYEVVNEIDGVDEVITSSSANFMTSQILFDQSVDPAEANQQVTNAVNEAQSEGVLPEQAEISVIEIDPASFLFEYDMLLSVYSTDPDVTPAELEEVANFVAQDFESDVLIASAEIQPLLETGINPVTSQEETRKTSFQRVAFVENGQLTYYQSITIGIDGVNDIDIIELSEAANERIAAVDVAQFGDEYAVIIGADFADNIKEQINSLQSNLATGLLAVALVSFLLISWRASIITGLFMVSVVAVSIVVLYLIGYTLNTITLFGLVLSLGLFVDDATIVVESIDANRKRGRKRLEIVQVAVRKIAAASFAGTFTTVLVFLPLAFLTGILGEFIRLLPITVIVALITSLFLSLIIIPVFSRFILLTSDKDTSWLTRVNPITKAETWLAKVVSDIPRRLKSKKASARLVAAVMFSLSIVLFMAGTSYASRVNFNIFPPTKDSNQIGYTVTYEPGTSIERAEQIADELNSIVAATIGDEVVRVAYGQQQNPSNRSSDAFIELTPFTERDVKSPELINNLQAAIDEAGIEDAEVAVLQFDAGPPVTDFPLQIQITEEDPERAEILVSEVEEYINGAVLERPNGTTFTIIDTDVNINGVVNRVDGQRTLTVGGAFDADDTSALLVASEDYVRAFFTPEYLESQGFSEDSIGFDFGQETENAESFASLAIAFPIALLLMYILLVAQFRSFLQPILIFMAIPFTFFGVFAGLYFTDNALSFFVQVGLIGLIGIAVNNTILLVTYANQEKQAGVRTYDAIANAIQKRFRPLITTTITTVVALLPLALSDPFWESLAFTIIFGLISSTFLVIVSFPYYYLGAEWLRMRFSRGTRKANEAKRASAKA